jgi:hypothetical protein
MTRRTITPFSLSFLDVMFCGFGAVVLLVMILNSHTLSAREKVHADLRGEVMRLEKEVLDARQKLVLARNALDRTERERVVTEGRARQVIERLRQLRAERADLDAQTLARRQHVKRLQADLKSLDEERRRLSEAARSVREQGRRVRSHAGDGDRQYLTGLKVGGKRVVILVDRSASMLDESVVNVLRLRNMRESVRRNAGKWRRTLATVEWLLSNLPQDARYQLYVFNTEAGPVLVGTEGTWLESRDGATMERAVSALKALLPEGGTSLYRAFDALRKLQPAPDNILLVTDGLPTQGRTRPERSTVSGDQRLEHFWQAVKRLPKGVPVNTVLLPMEGDPMAAAAFWKLATATQGSFMSPSEDWP